MSVGETAHRTSGYAIASLVLGIAGLAVFPLVPSILAVVFGNKAREEMRSGSATGAGLATAGVVLGWVGIALVAVGILVVALLWASF